MTVDDHRKRKSDSKDSKKHDSKKHKSESKDSKKNKVKKHKSEETESPKKHAKSKKHKEHDHKESEKNEEKKAVESTISVDKPDAPPASASEPSADEIQNFLEENSVGIEVPEGFSELKPYLEMSQVPVNANLKQYLQKFPRPTPIQSATWPHLLAGNDVIGVAETGSGKTLAFGLPPAQNDGKPFSSLIISPTRELAMQIHDSLVQLPGLKCSCVYGGVPRIQQQKELDAVRPSVVVGTPGRVKDLIGQGSLKTQSVNYLVLDEADRMLEKGFEEDIKEIISSLPVKRQTVMFTATWPPEVRQLASTFMNSQVVKVSVGDADELAANKRIQQIVEVIDPSEKERKLLQLLREYTRNRQKILIFALYKKEASRIERLLVNKGYSVAAVHGDLGQAQRTAALDDFRSGRKSLMLATDVAARGLDIPAVKVVLNLTFPLTAEDYVHRIGRTGRAGQTGIAHTLFTEQEKHLSGALINVLRGADQPVPEELLKFGSHTKKKEHSLYGAFFHNIDPNQKAKKIKFD